MRLNKSTVYVKVFMKVIIFFKCSGKDQAAKKQGPKKVRYLWHRESSYRQPPPSDIANGETKTSVGLP